MAHSCFGALAPGVFHELGQGGLTKNRSQALTYYERAANASKPFHMALHALGNHHRYHPDPTKVNLTLAKDFYLRAAKRDSPEVAFYFF